MAIGVRLDDGHQQGSRLQQVLIGFHIMPDAIQIHFHEGWAAGGDHGSVDVHFFQYGAMIAFLGIHR